MVADKPKSKSQPQGKPPAQASKRSSSSSKTGPVSRLFDRYWPYCLWGIGICIVIDYWSVIWWILALASVVYGLVTFKRYGF